MGKREILIEKLKEIAKDLSREYKCNIKIEVNVNKMYESTKINITEYNK